jgi:hypothetical protein
VKTPLQGSDSAITVTVGPALTTWQAARTLRQPLDS